MLDRGTMDVSDHSLDGALLPPACLHFLLAMAWMRLDLSFYCVPPTVPLLAQDVVLVTHPVCRHVQSTSGLVTRTYYRKRAIF